MRYWLQMSDRRRFKKCGEKFSSGSQHLSNLYKAANDVIHWNMGENRRCDSVIKGSAEPTEFKLAVNQQMRVFSQQVFLLKFLFACSNEGRIDIDTVVVSFLQIACKMDSRS